MCTIYDELVHTNLEKCLEGINVLSRQCMVGERRYVNIIYAPWCGLEAH